MTATASTEQSSTDRPPCEVTQEVRFAVVMYGGVSLAIYISGVTQELFELVRSTAQEPGTTTALLPASKLTGAGRVYRKLGQLLGGNTIEAGDLSEHDPIRARFVIDVISGTSAGGINGIVLAKALANDQPMDQLKELWITEGDIAGLLNDKQSVKGLPLRLQNPPQSLLNSQRMYAKLLDAFEGMERPPANVSPYVDELDLFVTTTDLEGLSLPVRLADRVVLERRHRNVFHFLYATEAASGESRNDFGRENNPFLAFAARCTSAFPFAFEPMRLADIALIPRYRGNEDKFKEDAKRWERFYGDYAPADFVTRSFGDGGYLDNKPFSYATDALLLRRADTRVQRKLIYIEPSPEHPEAEARHDGTYDVVENATKALVTLPGYETIRQDIQRVLDRNRLIERVERIISQLEDDVVHGNPQSAAEPTAAWVKRDLPEMIERKGVSYGGYHRLKVSALTDELAGLVTRLAGFKEDSDEFLAVRYLVRVWREAEYVEKQIAGSSPKPTQNQLLLDLDLSYRLRRVNFLRGKIDDLYPLDQRAENAIGCIDESLETPLLPIEDKAAFRRELLSIKQKLGKVFVDLRHVGRSLRAREHETDGLVELIAATGITSEDLKALLNQPTDDRRHRFAYELMGDKSERFKAFADKLIEHLRPALRKAAAACEALLRTDPNASKSTNAARQCLAHYYRYFDDYDLITFPMLYGTDVGESDVVDIIRISPEDATGLIDEEGGKRHKLAGITLFHFGAFLERLWRQNDMLWGRLDAAERIITVLLPEHPDEARQLIKEAQRAIVAEELSSSQLDATYRAVLEAVRQLCGSDSTDKGARELLAQVARLPVSDKVKACLEVCLGLDVEGRRPAAPADLINRQPNPEATLRSAARATTVIGKMLGGLSTRYPVGSPAALLTRFGQVAWGLVEVAVPRSAWNLISRYWLQLVYMFEVFLIAGGFLLDNETVQNFGLEAFGITIAVHTGIFLLGGYMRGRQAALRLTAILVIVSVIFLAVLGVIEAQHLLDGARHWWAGFWAGSRQTIVPG